MADPTGTRTVRNASRPLPASEFSPLEPVIRGRRRTGAHSGKRSRTKCQERQAIRRVAKEGDGLRKKGMSKSRAAAISNSPGASSKGGKSAGGAQSSRSSGGGGGGTSPEEGCRPQRRKEVELVPGRARSAVVLGGDAFARVSNSRSNATRKGRASFSGSKLEYLRQSFGQMRARVEARRSEYGDGRASRAVCSTRGIDLTDRLADDSSATLTSRHPLVRPFPVSTSAKRRARHRMSPVRSESGPQTEQRSHRRVVPERPRHDGATQTNQSR